MANVSENIPSLDVIHALQAVNYLTAAGLVCALYDHILTFHDEWKYIWRRGRWDVIKIIFIFNRYSIEAGLLYAVYVFAGFRGPLNNTSCQHFLTTMAALTAVSISTANVCITLRHYSLWDHRKSATIALWTGFAVTYLAIVVLYVFIVRELHRSVVYSPLINTCLLTKKPPKIIGAWACMIAFDVYTIILAITNALDRPHRHRVEVMVNLRRDGALLFIALLSLRVINLAVVSTVQSEEVFLVAFIVWAMISIALSRLLLRVEKIKEQANLHSASGLHMYEMDQWCSHEP